MGLDDFIPSENGESGPKSNEISEKFKESVKRATAGIKRVQKDEKKAKKFDLLLSSFLVEIIKNSKYDFILNNLFLVLSKGYSSNFLLGLLSLIYLPISDKIRELSKKDLVSFGYIKTFETIDFNDSTLDKEIKNRINFWIEDIIDISSIDYSSIQTQIIINLYNNSTSKKILIDFASKIFIFFFLELNINISTKKALDYSDFILLEIFKNISKIKTEEI